MAAGTVEGTEGLLLVRHAQSTWNAAGRWQGWADPPLSTEGERQAAEVGTRLTSEAPFDLLFTSDLQRARRTGALLAAALDLAEAPIVEVGLREHDVGRWTGLTRDEIEARWPGDIERFSTGVLTRPGGGEDRAAFGDRVVEAGRRIAAEAARRDARRILIVTHGGVLRALARATGAVEYRIGHLAGYRGAVVRGELEPAAPVDFLGSMDVQEAV